MSSWRSSTTISTEGTCIHWEHLSNCMPGHFIMLGAEWLVSDYSWLSSTWDDHQVYECSDPVGLHHVTIEDYGTSVRVLVDSLEAFNLSCDSITTGTFGFGAGDTTGSAPDYIPWYDNLLVAPDE